VTTFAGSSVSATGQSGPTSQRLALRYGRTLPVSLLLEPNEENHVFRLVVVNQMAAPIGRALLGTIVSTSLTKEELERGSSRLTNVVIPLETGRAITNLSRSLESPFESTLRRGCRPLRRRGDGRSSYVLS
jgi:hypothetical protein